MATSFEGRQCRVCGGNLEPRYFSLSKRTQKVAQSADGKVIAVLTDDMLADFCGNSCCSEAEASIVATLQLAYQRFSMTASCSVCRKPVERRAPHVTMNVAEFEDISQPWLISAQVLDEREIAVFCPDCAEPGQCDVMDEVVEAEVVENVATSA